MNPEDVMLSEVNQTQNGKQNCMNQKKKNNSNTETANRMIALGSGKDGIGQE